MNKRPDITAIRARAEKATAGPWGAKPYYGTSKSLGVLPFSKEDEDFITFANTDVPALCAYVEELEERLSIPSIVLEISKVPAGEALRKAQGIIDTASKAISELMAAGYRREHAEQMAQVHWPNHIPFRLPEPPEQT